MTLADAVDGVRAWPGWAPGTRLWRFGPPAAVAGIAAAAVSYVGVVDPNRPGHYPTCPFLFVTGWYCPGCGSLRAVHALAHADLPGALDHNLFLVLVLPYLIVGYLGWAVRRTTGRPRTRLAPPWVIWAVFTAVMAYWVLRNVPAFAWLAP